MSDKHVTNAVSMHGDVAESTDQAQSWFYNEIVREHFFNPKNVLKIKEEAENYKADAEAMVGSPACGDVMKMWIKVKDGKIVECKWQTFGCASAIASTSMLSVMVTENGGMKLEDALKITAKDVMDRLGGLPPRKFHCSVLGDQALREAIKNYQEKNN